MERGQNMRIYRVLAIVIFGIFTSYALYSDISTRLYADKKVTVRNGFVIETAYAFYLPNGMLEKIKVYRSAATGRGVIVVPVTFEGIKLEKIRDKYGF